jgi:hypothetical protein
MTGHYHVIFMEFPPAAKGVRSISEPSSQSELSRAVT